MFIIVLEIIKRILIVIFAAIILIIIVLFKAEIQSIVPKKIKQRYKIKTRETNKRKVFVMNSKEPENFSKMIILYLHGGSYVGALNNEHWNFLADIVDDTGATIIIPDYPLTPKYNYRNVFDMVEPLYKDIISKKQDYKFYIMGDSAGGGLSLALTQKMGEEKIELPDKTILLSPWLDVTLKNPNISQIEPNDPILNKLALRISGEHYAGKDGKNSYLVNPVNGPLDKIKNVTIFTGTYDILNADAKLLNEKAIKTNVKIDMREYDKAVHIWMLNRYSKKNSYKSEEAYQEIITLLKNN